MDDASPSPTRHKPSPVEVQDHRKNLDRFESLARRAGWPIRRGPADSWNRLTAEPPARVDTIISSFGIFTDVCEETLNRNDGVLDNRQLVWRMLQRLGLRGTSDLYEYISGGDVVEIYNRDFIQVFRNLEFFSVSSYTLEDLIHYPLHELFERDPVFTSSLHEEFKSALFGDGRGTIRSRVPRHVTREIFSQDRLIAFLEPKAISPLRDPSQKVVGFVAVLNVRLQATPFVGTPRSSDTDHTLGGGPIRVVQPLTPEYIQ